jgi:hypothetical protein
MDASLVSEVKSLIKSDPDWVEKFDSKRLKVLCAINRDILQEEVTAVDSEGFLTKKQIVPRKFLNKYTLYKRLREKRRCPKNKHAEEIIKTMED